MELKTTHINIPVDLCKFALQGNGHMRATRIYLASKFLYSGIRKGDRSMYIEIAKLLGCSERTVRRGMKTLKEWNWVGVENTNGYYHFRSFRFLRYKMGIKYARSSKMELKYLQGNTQNYLMAALASSVAITMNKRNQTNKRSLKHVSAMTLAKMTGRSLANVRVLRSKASKEGLIYNYQDSLPVKDFSGKELKTLRKSGVDSITLELVGKRGNHNLETHRLFFGKDNRVRYQLPNLMGPKNIRMSKRKNGLYKGSVISTASNNTSTNKLVSAKEQYANKYHANQYLSIEG